MLAEITIRLAVEADDAAIRAMVRAEAPSPRNLHWSRFLVAEEGDSIVGAQQVRVHEGGTHEVASKVVLPQFWGRGISTELPRASLAQEHGPLYVQCSENWATYYEQFGFCRVRVSKLPSDQRQEHHIARGVVALQSLYLRRRLSVVPMKRDA